MQHTIMPKQTAVTAYFLSEQLLLFASARQYNAHGARITVMTHLWRSVCELSCNNTE